MFYLIGVGQKPWHLTIEAVNAVKKCKKVYFDSYTNCWTEQQLKAFEKILKKKIIVLNRKQIEEEFSEILKTAEKQNIALLVLGNALTATTHIQLLIDAKKIRVPFCVIAGISITDFLGSTGLDAYKFGRITTIVSPKENFAPESFFDVIEKNHSANYHTLCLLEYDAEKNFVLDIPTAIAILEKIEEKRNSAIVKNSLLIGLFGLGTKKEKIIIGKEELKKNNTKIFPQSLIVCAQLNEKEKEAISALVKK